MKVSVAGVWCYPYPVRHLAKVARVDLSRLLDWILYAVPHYGQTTLPRELAPIAPFISPFHERKPTKFRVLGIAPDSNTHRCMATLAEVYPGWITQRDLEDLMEWPREHYTTPRRLLIRKWLERRQEAGHKSPCYEYRLTELGLEVLQRLDDAYKNWCISICTDTKKGVIPSQRINDHPRTR